ncbi:hypothetical protein BDQ17DRAFT_1273557 [Cyathus striatus]|nr:hypothetical protein BDQ17DRAFT_1273557 [Cyathus striatus]
MSQTSKTESPGLKRTSTTLTFAQQQAGLLVTNELNKAIEECKKKVKRISKECRMKNRKFRDIEFDLENDKYRCLEGLFSDKGYNPSDVQRVTQIFDKPKFYAKNGYPQANDIYQGALGDCWLMSALATVSTCPGLLEKFCVERDEAVGVYGFIFFKNNAWVSIVIDDLLFTRIPKYEELNNQEQELYHFDKESYNRSARQGGKQLYFAKSGDDGETWVPLLEKAYAKLHGSYASISGGWDSEAIEDMTGGVSSFIPIKDIFDTDQFWTDELLRVNKDRLFGCSFDPLSPFRSYRFGLSEVQGVIGGHAYSVLRAIECKGKRFLVIRNPWGKTEWKGPWSDGSKEWQGEWLEILPVLGHVFGDDGQFVMEYKDFLNVWQDVDRTILFDDSWVMSSQWLHIPMKPLPSPWQFGDVSFTFSLSGPSLAVIVLSQLDRRYFQDLAGRSSWSLDFILVKEGEKEPIAESNHAWFYTRSVNLETELDTGNYIVYVRIDRLIKNKNEDQKIEDAQLRQLSRVLAEKSKCQSIASNLKKGYQEEFATTTITDLIEKDYALYKKKLQEKEQKEDTNKPGDESSASDDGDDNSDEVTTTTTTTTVVVKKKVKKDQKPQSSDIISENSKASGKEVQEFGYGGMKMGNNDDPLDEVIQTIPVTIDETKKLDPYSEYLTQDDNNLFLGLKVYTKKEVPVTIEGRLRAELDVKSTEEKKEQKAEEKMEQKVEDVPGQVEASNVVNNTTGGTATGSAVI